MNSKKSLKKNNFYLAEYSCAYLNVGIIDAILNESNFVSVNSFEQSLILNLIKFYLKAMQSRSGQW